jgi:hypothetical protein
MLFHGGGRRGFDACILCHGAAAAEDRPQYVAANAPATAGVSIGFRTMLHKIHMGSSELTNASTYLVNGFGSTAYPNNYGTVSYEEVVFPALPGAAANCTMCHGTSTKWYAPKDRNHPTDQNMRGAGMARDLRCLPRLERGSSAHRVADLGLGIRSVRRVPRRRERMGRPDDAQVLLRPSSGR